MDAERIRDAVARYEGPLTRYAERLAGDVDRGRDLVQETFLRLCREDPARLDGHTAEWLFTVCRNLAMDEKRRRRMSPLNLETRSREPSPPEAMERLEGASRIKEALSRLPDPQQEVLRLKFQEGLSYREISRIMSLTVSNVGVLIHTGLKTLRSVS